VPAGRVVGGDMSDSSHNDDLGHFSVEHRVRRLTSVWFVPALTILIGLSVVLTTDIIIKLLPRRGR